jgi:hypothetical protein
MFFNPSTGRMVNYRGAIWRGLISKDSKKQINKISNIVKTNIAKMKKQEEEIAINEPQISYEEAQQAIQLLLSFGKQKNIPKILDRYKWRELFTSEILNHEVFKKSSNNRDQFAADAYSESGELCEYKSNTLSKKAFEELKKGEKGIWVSGIYNGAYSKEIVDSYKDIKHYLSLFYNEEIIKIYEISSDYVIEQLYEGLEYRNTRKTKSKKEVSTNLNCVKLNTSTYDKSKIKEIYSSI